VKLLPDLFAKLLIVIAVVIMSVVHYFMAFCHAGL